jgi:hypothetical protein
MRYINGVCKNFSCQFLRIYLIFNTLFNFLVIVNDFFFKSQPSIFDHNSDDMDFHSIGA